MAFFCVSAVKWFVLYRLYAPGDFDALYALEDLCFVPPLRFCRQSMRRLVQHPQAAVWIAEEDGTMTGFAIVEWSKGKNGITAYIQTIEVAPEARCRGVGSGLLIRIEDSARAAGAGLIWLHVDAQNAGAVRLYETQGYHSRGRRENFYPEGRAALIYSKPLSSEQAEDSESVRKHFSG